MLTERPQELLAHGRTLQEMTSLIQCHALVFQKLEDLKEACIEAADGESQVRDFEVGVFCGQYKTPIPANYFQCLSLLCENKTTVSTAVADQQGDHGAILIASSSFVNPPVPQEALPDDGSKILENHEDIRYAYYSGV